MTPRSIRRARERRNEKDLRHRLRIAGQAALGASTVAGGMVLFAAPAHAADLVVTSLADDGTPGTLRDAVDQANSAPGADTITFAAGVTGTIDLSGTELALNDATTITGPGEDALTIDAGGMSRIFDINNGSTDPVIISGLSLAHGQSGGEGGAVYVGEGDSAAVTLDRVTIRDSVAAATGGGFALENGGLVTFTGVTVTGNQAGGDGGGVYVDDSRSMVMTDSVVSGNTAGGNGGGILLYNLYNGRNGGTGQISGVEISGNTAANQGGGLALTNPSGQTTFATTVVNSTISGNHATAGGAVFVASAAATPPTLYFPGTSAQPQVFTSDTIASNTAGSSGGVLAEAGPKTLQNTIVADNTNGDLGLTNGGTDSFSLDFSLIEDPANTPTTDVTPGSNLIGQDPQLGALADNGGPTRTEKPASTSPVVDQGNAFSLTADQRGLARPYDFAGTANPAGGDASDIGAVELQAAVVPTPTPTPTTTPTATPTTPASTETCLGEPATIVAVAGQTTEGTAGRDVIVGTAGPDMIDGAGGDDLICAGDGNDNVFGGTGDDKILGEGGNDRVMGEDGDDRLSGNQGDDQVSGGQGDDKIFGRTGQDKLVGGGGADRINGNAGDDHLAGGPGADKLFGRGGQDRIDGDGGSDLLVGGGGHDRIDGGAGDNTVRGRP